MLNHFETDNKSIDIIIALNLAQKKFQQYVIGFIKIDIIQTRWSCTRAIVLVVRIKFN